MAARVISSEPLDSRDANWINLVRIRYQDRYGKVRTWEAVRRTTKPKDSAVDAVLIVAVLEKSTGPEILLEKQFRPPADKTVIEFPAGLVDEGESPEDAAVRELREETGYVGDVIPDAAGVRPVLWSSPASSSSCNHMIHVKVDLKREENKTPQAQLEDGEHIECFSVPLKDLHAECRKLEAQGYAIDGKVGAFAEGIHTATLFGVLG